MSFRLLVLGFLIAVGTSSAIAHHSYVIYDTDMLKEVSGTVISWQYRSPHPELVVEVGVPGTEEQEPVTELWKFEGISIFRWRQLQAPTDIAFEGEEVSVKGWPAKNGDHSMLLSGITRESGEYIEILDRVLQGEAGRIFSD